MFYATVKLFIEFIFFLLKRRLLFKPLISEMVQAIKGIVSLTLTFY